MARRRQNAADDAQLARARRFDQHTRVLDDAALEAVLLTPAGRRFVWNVIVRLASVFEPSWTGNTETFYHEGRRAVGIQLMKEVQSKFPHLWKQVLLQMTTEREAIASAVEEGGSDDVND